MSIDDADALVAALERLLAKKRNIKHAAMQQLLTGRTRLPGFDGMWEIVPLSELIGGLEAGVSVNSVDTDLPVGTGQAAILKTSAVFNGRFLTHECKIIAERDIDRARLTAQADSIVISRMNTPDLVGECGYVETDHPSLFLPDRLWMAKAKKGSDTSAKWLNALLSSSEYKPRIKATATGTSGSMKNISKHDFLALPIARPNGREQIAIATILSTMDAELSAIELRIAKTRALKQAMMQELLTGRTRLIPPKETHA